MAVPGPDLDRQGTANADVLKDWTARVLQLAGEAGFREVAEMLVARFSPNAPTDTDGTWPCQPVRDLLENLQSGLVERAGGRTLRGRTGQPPGQEPGDLTLRNAIGRAAPGRTLWLGRQGRRVARAGARPTRAARGTRSGLTSKRGANMARKRPSREDRIGYKPRSGRVRRQGLEPRTRGLRVCCSAN